MPLTQNISGPSGQMYAEQKITPDETKFTRDNTSSAYYNSPYFVAHKNQVQAIPPTRKDAKNVQQPVLLSDFLPKSVLTGITTAKKISFHATGDTGAAKVNARQTVGTALSHQAAVADAMAKDVQASGGAAPAFFFHLGDVIYNFGEGQYYYDQFYEPYRDYDRPIFAIPGNHDGMVFGQGSTAPQFPTLDAFLTNFCSPAPGPSPDGGGLVRSAMTQPGVYFTLDAPFVSIIGLYSNVLDGPGVISSQNGHFPIVNDQLDFLISELTRLKPKRQSGERAVILALHHPPLSADAKHGGSTGELQDIDSCCKKVNFWPDVVLSGHAHLYQRFTRSHPNGKQAPYVVCGAGGFAATPPRGGAVSAPVTSGDHTLEVAPIVEFGYLTVTTDAKTLTVTFKSVAPGGAPVEKDTVTLDLQSGTLTAGGHGAPPARKPGKRPPAGGGRAKPAARGRRGKP
jgi:hypothetical protein